MRCMAIAVDRKAVECCAWSGSSHSSLTTGRDLHLWTDELQSTMENQGSPIRSRHCGFERLLCFGFVSLLFAGLERQGFGELYDDTAQETAYIIYPVHVTRTREICHIERIIRAVTGDTEASGYVLSGTGTAIAGMARKCRCLARYVHHLPL